MRGRLDDRGREAGDGDFGRSVMVAVCLQMRFEVRAEVCSVRDEDW